MNDFISRQAAIDKLNERQRKLIYCFGFENDVVKIMDIAKSIITAIPPVQPERLTDDDFETIRIHLNAYKENLCNQHRWEEAEEYQRIIDRFMEFASAQPNHNADVSKKEIIHCNECKFAHMTVDGDCKYCDIWFPDEKTYMPGDYFCASAERSGEQDGTD